MAVASCPRCGTPLSGASRFCQACGAPVLGAEETADGLPPVTAAGKGAAAPAGRTAFPTLGRRRGPSPAMIAALVGGVLVAAALVTGGVVVWRGRGDAAPAAGQVTAVPTLEPATATLPATAEGTPPPATLGATPVRSPSGTPPPPTPRVVNGLRILDETWVGQVAEAGGLRIRSAPRVEVGNVVGSVAQGTRVNVEGRVLNGQEAEAGKGTEWLIVGPNQYIYAAPGYVERLR